jgi:Tfp pilus assembly protein PilF
MSDGSVNEIWNKALLAYNAGNINNAIGMLNTIAQADARLSFNLACLYIQKNNYSAALSLLKNALKMDNSLSIAYFQRAYIRYHQGNFDSAYKNYAKTIVVSHYPVIFSSWEMHHKSILVLKDWI